jgi:HORMA domain-containing protein
VSISTYTDTYTAVDIRRVFDQFAADYDMAAQSTGLVADSHLASVIHDVKVLAEHEFLDGVDIVLRNATGKATMARKYQVSTDASLWTSNRPGNSMWPRTPDGSLRVVVSYSARWKALSEASQTKFRSESLRLSWGASDIDTAYPGLNGTVDRHYASNAYGLRRTSYT